MRGSAIPRIRNTENTKMNEKNAFQGESERLLRPYMEAIFVPDTNLSLLSIQILEPLIAINSQYHLLVMYLLYKLLVDFSILECQYSSIL
jgi:hypothetical protein